MGKKSNKSGAVKRLEKFEEGMKSGKCAAIYPNSLMMQGVPVANIPGAYEAIGDAKKLLEQDKLPTHFNLSIMSI